MNCSPDTSRTTANATQKRLLGFNKLFNIKNNKLNLEELRRRGAAVTGKLGLQLTHEQMNE